MKDKGDQVRKSNWSWRIAQEAQEKASAGWYPFFATLTLDPKLFLYYGEKPDYSKGPLQPIYLEPKDLW